MSQYKIGLEKNVSISTAMLSIKAMKYDNSKFSLESDTAQSQITQIVHVLNDKMSLRIQDIEDNKLITEPTLLGTRFEDLDLMIKINMVNLQVF